MRSKEEAASTPSLWLVVATYTIQISLSRPRVDFKGEVGVAILINRPII